MNANRIAASTLPLLFALTSFSCGDIEQREGAEQLGEARSALVNGVTDSTNAYSASAQVSGCSGVLIARRTLLTVAHCFADFTSGCRPPSEFSVPVYFPGPTGSMAAPTLGERKRIANKFVTLPGAVFDVAGQCGGGDVCPDLAAHPGAINCRRLAHTFGQPPCKESDSIGLSVPDRRRDFMLIFLTEDAPDDVTPAKVLVHPNYKAVSSSFASFAGLESWAEATKPLVVVDGYGAGTAEQQYNNDCEIGPNWLCADGTQPGLTTLKKRQVGLSRWSKIKGTFSGAWGYDNCQERIHGDQDSPSVSLIPDDVTVADMNDVDVEAFPTQAPPGVQLPGAQATHGGGDSGGVVYVGRNSAVGLPPFKNGLGPTPLPLPASGDNYDPEQAYIVGLTGIPGGITADNRPINDHGVTYSEEVSGWLASILGKDTDGDGIPDVGDGCPTDPSQEDADSDGIPDKCDPCPLDPSNDSDGDGFCYPEDRCPLTRETTVTNTNLDFELVNAPLFGSPPFYPIEPLQLGDACDPVPTLNHYPVYTAGLPGGKVLGFKNNFILRPRAPHYIPNPLLPIVNAAETAVPISGIESHFRFCHDENVLGVPCTFAATLANEAGQVAANNSYVDEDEFTAYHRMAFASVMTGNRWDRSMLLNYDDVETPGRSFGWDSEADRARLEAMGYVPSNTPLKGHTWFHNTSVLGSFSAPIYYQDVLQVHGDKLANALMMVDTGDKLKPLPDPTSPALIQIPVFSSGFDYKDVELFWWLKCPTCREPLLEQPPFESSLIVNHPTQGPILLLGNDKAMPIALPDGLRQSAATGLVHWVQGVEPALEMGPASPLALALSSNYTAVVDDVVLDDEVPKARADRRPRTMPLSGGAEYTSPEARRSPLVIYSRIRGQMFLFGGTSNATNRELHDVWSYNVDEQRWNELLMPELSGKIIAGTYAFKDTSLYLIEETPFLGKIYKRRFIRINMNTAEITQLGQWLSLRQFEKLWLQLDRGGQGLLLAASSSRLGGLHVITSLAFTDAGALQAKSIHSGVQELLAQPMVDPVGYTVLLKKNNRMDMQRVSELRSLAGLWQTSGLHGWDGCLQ